MCISMASYFRHVHGDESWRLPVTLNQYLVSHECTKYVEVGYHFVRGKILEEKILNSYFLLVINWCHLFRDRIMQDKIVASYVTSGDQIAG